MVFSSLCCIRFPRSHSCDYSAEKSELVSLLLEGGGWHTDYIDSDICNHGCESGCAVARGPVQVFRFCGPSLSLVLRYTGQALVDQLFKPSI